jgi:hypothetical protein
MMMWVVTGVIVGLMTLFIIWANWLSWPTGETVEAKVLGKNGESCVFELDGERETAGYSGRPCLYFEGEVSRFERANSGAWRPAD